MSIVHQTHHCGCNCWYGFAWPAFVEVEINQEANTYKILSCKLPTGALETEQVVRDRFVKNWREYRPALGFGALKIPTGRGPQRPGRTRG